MNELPLLRDLHPIITEYEDYITALTNQLEIHKKEQDSLKSECKTLLAENNSLAAKLSSIMRSNEENLAHIYSDNHFHDSLKAQLDLALSEKQTVYDLWQESLQTIDILDSELKLLQGIRHNYMPKPEYKSFKEKYEKELNNLKQELKHTKDSAADAVNTSKEELEKKTKQLQNALEEQACTRKLVKKLENVIEDVKEKQKEIVDVKDNLLKTLNEKNELINQLNFKETESKRKVNEALQLVEAALVEKDAALQRETQTKEEMDKLTKLMVDLVDETKEKVKNEIEINEAKYKIKLTKINLDLDSLKEDLALKNEELNKTKKEFKSLEDELNRIKKGNICIDDSNTSKLLILEKNLESTFQKLLLSEKTNQQLLAERDALKNDLDQMANYYQQDVKLKEIEKLTLTSKIKSLQDELQKSNLNIMHLINKLNELNSATEEMKNKMYTEMDVNEKMNQVKFLEQINEIQTSSNKVQIKLQEHLEMQIELNNKWKSEVYEITEKLQRRLIELKTEITLSKKENTELKIKLGETESKLNEYKNALELLYVDVNNAVRI